VFENRVLKRIFGPKGDEVTRGWRKLHDNKHHDLYSLQSINSYDSVEEDKMGGACSKNRGEEERVYVIGDKNRRKEPLGRPRRRRVDNIKMDLGEIG
jgi:hypothetical protein